MTTLGNTEASTTFPATAADVGADASGAAASAQSAAIAAAATDATTKANAAQAAAIAASQPLDADLTAIAGLTSSADKLPYFTGSGAAALADITSVARTLLGSVTEADERNALQLGTSDTPQFAEINLGNVSNTTITRISAGDIGVEGNRLYRAGGTDVPVADGGTGSSTAAAAVDALGGASSTGTGGLVRATSPTLVTPALGTPASGVATNLTGTAASLTAGTVTTNANLTGDVTSVGNATTISAAKATGKTGRTMHSATVDYQLPGIAILATGTFIPSINTVYYHLCYAPTRITLDQMAFNVTTGPAGNAKVRVGVTAADTDNQPTGAPLGDVEVAVATSFTGIKTATISAVVGPGNFLIAVNMDTTMTFRSWQGPPIGGWIDAALGSGSNIAYTFVAQTYPAANWPTPGLAWTGFTGAASAAHWVVVRVSVP